MMGARIGTCPIGCLSALALLIGSVAEGKAAFRFRGRLPHIPLALVALAVTLWCPTVTCSPSVPHGE